MTGAFPPAPPQSEAGPAGAAIDAPGGSAGGAGRVVRIVDALVEGVLVALLVFLPAAFGTVERWSELVAYAAGGAIAVLLGVRAVLVPPTRLASPATAAIALFVLFAFAQLVPLPRGVASVVAPNTVTDKTKLLQDLPGTDAPDALSRITLSFYPLATRRDLRVVLFAVTVFAAVVTIYREPRRVRRLLVAIALVGGAVASLALAQDITGTDRIYWTFRDDAPVRSGPFYNHSHFGQFMNLSIGAALGLLLVRLHRGARSAIGAAPGSPAPRARAAALVWPAGVIVLGLLTIALSLTRGGVISMVAAGGLTLIVLLSRGAFRWLGGVLVLLAVAALAALLYAGFDHVYDRMTAGGGIAGRAQILRDLSHIVRRYPLTGTGLGTFENVYPAYDNTGTASVASHAENEYAQVASEMGVVALAAVLAFAAVIVARYGRAVRAGGPIGVAAVGLGYGLVAVMVHSLSDFGQHLPANACLSAITCGLLYNLGGAASRDGSSRDTSVSVPRRVLGFAVLMLCIGLSAWSIAHAARAYRAHERWVEARRLNTRLERQDELVTSAQYDQLLAATEAVIAIEPDYAYYHFRLGSFCWEATSNHHDKQTGTLAPAGTALALRAVDALNQARRLCPTFGEVYTILGQIERDLLDRPTGVTHLKTGFRLARNDPTAAYMAGDADARRGRWDDALAAFRHAVRLDYETIYDVAELYLELGEPARSLAVAEPNWRLMMHLDVGFARHGGAPEVKDRVHARFIELLGAACANPDAPANDIAMFGLYRIEQRRDAEGERQLARALAKDWTHLDWRLARAEALARLGRFAEAIDEARTAQRLHPDATRARELADKLTRGGER